MIRVLPAPRRTQIRLERFRLLTGVASLLAPLLVIGLLVVLYSDAAPSISRFGARFLVGVNWNPVTLDFGALPFIYGTLATSAIAIAIALPVGVSVGLVLAEPGAGGLRGLAGTAVELLAAIPSVVYGIWALYVMAPFVFTRIEVPVSRGLSSVPLLSGSPSQTSLFTASLVLAIMILPTLSAISRDVLRAVPGGLRQAAIALGATWWETTWKVILPAARAGIFGATVLALGRALGETIAVTMVIGNRPEIPASIFSPAYTLASVIANEFAEATGPVYPAALIELGLILILVSIAVNVAALLLVGRSIEAPR